MAAVNWQNPTSWTPGVPITHYRLNLVSNDLLYLFARLGGTTTSYDGVTVGKLLTLNGSGGVAPLTLDPSGLLLQPLSYLPAGQPMYLIGHKRNADIYPLFGLDVNVNTYFSSFPALIWSDGAHAPDVKMFRPNDKSLSVSFTSTPGAAGFNLYAADGRWLFLGPSLTTGLGNTLVQNLDTAFLYAGSSVPNGPGLVIGPGGQSAGMRFDSFGHVTFYTGSSPDTNQGVGITDQSQTGMLYFVPKSTGGYNSLVQSGDSLILYLTTPANRGLVIGPWPSGGPNGGLRMDSFGNVTITGNLTVTGNPGPVLLARTVLGAAQGSFVVSTVFPVSYPTLRIVVDGAKDPAAPNLGSNPDLALRFNADATAGNYGAFGYWVSNGALTTQVASYATTSETFMRTGDIGENTTSGQLTDSGVYAVDLQHYNDTTSYKIATWNSSAVIATGGPFLWDTRGVGFWKPSQVVTSVTLYLALSADLNSRFRAGTRISVYGLP